MKTVTCGLLLVAISASSGCVWTQGEVPSQTKSKIVAGTTTKADILQELGDPDQKIDLGNGNEQFSYIKEDYRPFGGVFTGKSTNTEFWIKFDANQKVLDSGERPTAKTKNYFGAGGQ